MANKYSSVTVTNYNASPPPDDGSNTSANEVTWAGQKSKLADPLKTAIDAINSNTLSAFGQQFGYNIESISTDLTLGASDTNKLIATTGTHTLSLPAASTAGNSTLYIVENTGTGVTTIAPNGTDQIDGSTNTYTLAAGEWAIIACDGASWRTLRISIPTLVNIGNKNRFHNGGCEVAQRTVAPSLSTSFQYGKVDRFLVAATAGAVSAGTVTQDTSSGAGRTGYALKAAGATLTGSAVISAKQRIESVDAVLLKNQNASFSVRVFQDTGAAINYTITIKKPTVADNYAATTTIATSAAISVPSSTDTQITFTNQALGDCSNGLEIQVDAACGAVTTKNFSFTEWQLEEGPVVTSFERRGYAQELRDCQRFAELVSDAISITFAFPFSTASAATSPLVSYAQKKRVTPTLSLLGSASLGATGATSPALGTAFQEAFQFSCTGTGPAQYITITLTPGTGGILASADL